MDKQRRKHWDVIARQLARKHNGKNQEIIKEVYGKIEDYDGSIVERGSARTISEGRQADINKKTRGAKTGQSGKDVRSKRS